MVDTTPENVSWQTAINYALDDNTINLLPTNFSFFNAILLIPFFYIVEFIRVEFILLIGVALLTFLKFDNNLDKVSYLIHYLWVKSIVSTIILSNNEFISNLFYNFVAGKSLIKGLLLGGLALGLAFGLIGGFTYNRAEGIPFGFALGFGGSLAYTLLRYLALTLTPRRSFAASLGLTYGVSQGLAFSLALGFAFSLAGGLPFGLGMGFPENFIIEESKINDIVFILIIILPYVFAFSLPFSLAGIFSYLTYLANTTEDDSFRAVAEKLELSSSIEDELDLDQKIDLSWEWILLFGFWGTLSLFLAYGLFGGLAGNLAVSFTNKIMNLVNKKFKNIILLLYALIISSNKYRFPIIFIIKILFYKFNFIKFSEVNQEVF